MSDSLTPLEQELLAAYRSAAKTIAFFDATDCGIGITFSFRSREETRNVIARLRRAVEEESKC